MGSFVCTDGDRRCPDHIGAVLSGAQQGAEFDGNAACGEFLLAAAVFQCRSLWICPALAAAVVGIGVVDDPCLEEGETLAAWLQIPYLLWLSFAVYLNAGVWYLN